jgi:purine-binding chemotaxis protein CheW
VSKATDNRYMEFKLDGQPYAIPLLRVKEVIPLPEVTPVPNTQSHFEGMINLRGQILGVFNIRKRLMTKNKEIYIKNPQSRGEVVIILEYQGIFVGMIVDEVTRVIHATPETIKPAPLKENEPAQRFISSVIQSGDDLIMAIHAEQLLDLEILTNTAIAA